VGIKTLCLCFKYGTIEAKENLILSILKTDVSLFCTLKFGYVLLKKIYNYSKKSSSVKILNQYFESNFANLMSKTSNFEALQIFLTSQSKEKQSMLLYKVVSNVKLDGFKMKDIMEFYQKCKNCLHMSLIHFIFVINYELAKK